ncbi:MAG: polyphosphate kinase 1 [Deltaproteobacteria bacterium]|nr:polyphosphate kinase 1 [Deltaproteobacteria bacterium]
MEPSALPLSTVPPSPASQPPPAPLSASLSVVPAQELPAGTTHGSDARLFINRELSWLSFNERVLEEACDPAVPPLERFKFLSICCSNLDEFFMIRVAGLKQQIAGHIEESGPDAMSPSEQLQHIATRTHEMVARLYRALGKEILPVIEKAGVRLMTGTKLTQEQEKFAADYFAREVFPVLTPIAIDPGHPFPHLRHKSLNVAVRFAGNTTRLRSGVVPVPAVLPRLVEIPDDKGKKSYLLLEDLIAKFVTQLFPGMPISGCHAFRVTRNWDLSIDEEEGEDLLVTIEREVRRRDRGGAVRLEISASADGSVSEFLVRALKLGQADVYKIEGPLNIPDLLPLLGKLDQKELHDEPFTPIVPPALAEADREVFRLIRERDYLLHHPYESFEPVVNFIESAADDPQVLAIKMTLYRTGKDSPIVRALQRAAENGKQVTALVELKARMDEEANILWARALEQSGVHVVYGLIGYKTHCKVALVVRREAGGLRRYAHLGTGNYNPGTSRLYTDLSLFTAKDDFCADATAVFNLLTGYSQPAQWKKLKVAPMAMKPALMELIERATQLAMKDGKGRIVAKMNALSDPDVIRALYRASQAGVQIDLVVRGICCLKPGVPGISERIRVTSIIDRFLEHSRVWFFEAGGKREVFLASSDWMNRNFIKRVEIAFPIEDAQLKERILDEILATVLGDNVKSRQLKADGSYERVTAAPGSLPVRSQERFMNLARRVAAMPDPQPAAPPHEIFPAGHKRGSGQRKKKRMQQTQS